MRPIPIILTLLLALGAVEGVAYWWMHPKPAGLGEPVLTYRPSFRGQGTGIGDRGSEIRDQEHAIAHSSSSNQQSTISNQQSSISPSSTTILLPDVVAKSLPSLHCSTGTAARIDREDDVTIHIAFFEWELSSSTNVLEAFKHLPEECMGSIGMTLIEKAPVRTFVVRDQGTGGSGQGSGIGDRGLEMKDQEQATAPNSSSNSTFNIENSKFAAQSLSFDHTVFRDPRGVVIHAFKATWVSGAGSLLGDGFRGGLDQQRQLRWKAALKRFRPAHARVVQGAVRGIRNPDLAWKAFEESMLVDLRMD